LYPELGIGARRVVSRFHRAQFAEAVPWVLPPAEDLARGADLETVNDTTVAIVPRGAAEKRTDDNKPIPYATIHLVFANGQLAERGVREMPGDKLLYREPSDPARGLVRLIAAKGQELSKRELALAPATEPALAPDTSNLVVLPLPFRTRNHAYEQ